MDLQRNIGSVRVLAALAGWMFRIIERECYRLLRIKRRTEELSDALCASLAQPASADGLRRDLAGAMAALPLPYREVLVLRDTAATRHTRLAEPSSASPWRAGAVASLQRH